MATILKLDKRLETIVDLCDNNKVIADIGCDHGLVTAELILEEKAEKVVASEISRDCLNKAIVLADKINIIEFISFREGDGFSKITKHDKVNQAVIAGMGGETIIDILEKKPRRLFNFVLQPMNKTIELRRYLLSHKYKILVDKLIKVDNKYYDVLKVTRGRQKLTELEIYFGLTNFRENYEMLYEYLTEKKAKLDNLKERLHGSLNTQNTEMLNNINEALALFNQGQEEVEQQEEQPNQEVQQNQE